LGINAIHVVVRHKAMHNVKVKAVKRVDTRTNLNIAKYCA